MKYVLIKVLIGAVSCNIYVSEKYIIEFDSIHHSTKPFRILLRQEDKVFQLDLSTFEYQEYEALNIVKQKSWNAQVKEELVSIDKILDEAMVDKLRVTVKTPSRFTKGHDNMKSYEYLSLSHPILSKYLTSNGKVEHRALTPNYHNMKDEYPFLYKSYLSDKENNSGVIYEIIDIKEGVYNEKELLDIEAWIKN